MPSLILIAGPNGAGKSTVSKELLIPNQIEAFDFDKSFNELWASFDFDPLLEEGVKTQIIDKFRDHVDQAFSKNLDLSYETNFHVESNLKIREDAKLNGFRTELVFIGLASPELAINRVNLRVQKGGHFVDEETIISRYYNGLQMLDEYQGHFDELHLFESLKDYKILKCIVRDSDGPKLYNKPSFYEKIPRLMSDLDG